MCSEVLYKLKHYSWLRRSFGITCTHTLYSCTCNQVNMGKFKSCCLTIRKVLHEDACTRNRQPPASNVPGCKDTSVDKLAGKKMTTKPTLNACKQRWHTCTLQVVVVTMSNLEECTQLCMVKISWQFHLLSKVSFKQKITVISNKNNDNNNNNNNNKWIPHYIFQYTCTM